MTIEFTIIENSSNLAGYKYVSALQQFFVQFKSGDVYLYTGVPADVADGFAESFSKGSYLAQRIKPHFPCTKCEVEIEVEISENIPEINVDE